MSPEAVTSIITFVLNSALLSSFIIPQVQKLKEIKDQLFQFKLMALPARGTVMRAALDSLEGPGMEVEQLQGILDVYRVRSAELWATVRWFYASVSLALLALILSVLWPSGRESVLSIHPILQVALMLLALKSYSTDPDRLSSPLYLVRECEINPHLLVSAMGLGVTFDSGLGPGRRQDWDDPLNINLSMNLRVYGFRFMFILADEEDKVFFASWGPITAKTRQWRHLLHPALGMSEINRIEIGKFKFNQFATAKELRGYFLLFLPFFEHEKLNPMLATMTIDVPGRASGNMLSASGSTTRVSSDRNYAGVSYSGAGSDVRDLGVENLPRDNIPIINRVLRKLRSDFLCASKIESIDDPNGLIGTE